MNQPIEVTEAMLGSLKATRPWVKFLAIVWFVGLIIAVLFGLAMITGIYGGFSTPGMPKSFTKVFGVFYIVMALVYVMPILYLYRYAKAIAGLGSSTEMATFEEALKQQKSFWKYLGIYIIVVVVLYVLLIIGFSSVGIYLAAHHP